MMPIVVAAVALCTLPVDIALHDRVDRIEINTLVKDCGTAVWTQVIAWDDVRGVDVVRDWKMISDRPHTIQRTPRGYRLCFLDGDNLRVIEAERLSVTAAFDDPELENRGVLAKELRRGLKRPRR